MFIIYVRGVIVYYNIFLFTNKMTIKNSKVEGCKFG